MQNKSSLAADSSSRNRSILFFILVYFGLFLLYIYANLFRNHLPYDDGRILANSWRILNGEFPYRDFIYIHPPASLYLHVLPLLLPEGWQFLGARCFFLFEMAIAGFAPCFWAVWNFPHMRSFRLAALSIIFFAFSLHDFTPMPWPTVDGIFLASIGLTLLLFSHTSQGSRTQSYFRAGGAVFIFGSALCKQGFIFLPLALLAFSLCEIFLCLKQRRSLRAPLWTFLSLVLSGAAFISFLYFSHALIDFRTQLAVRSGNGLWYVGLRPYLFGPFQLAILLGFMIPLSEFFVQIHHKFAKNISGLFEIATFLLLVATALISYRMNAAMWTYILFWLLVGILLGRLVAYFFLNLEDRPAFIGLNLAAILLAWASSISLGYQVQLLGIMPLALILHDRLGAESLKLSRRIFVGTCAIIILFAFIRVDLKREHLGQAVDNNLGEVFPRFGKVYGTANTAESYADLRNLIQSQAAARMRPFVVIPHFPLIYFLSNTLNPLDVNWVHEIEYANLDQRLWNSLKSKKPIIFIMRHIDDIHGEGNECKGISNNYFSWNTNYSKQYGSENGALIPNLILKSKLLLQTKYFCVFDPEI